MSVVKVAGGFTGGGRAATRRQTLVLGVKLADTSQHALDVVISLFLTFTSTLFSKQLVTVTGVEFPAALATLPGVNVGYAGGLGPLGCLVPGGQLQLLGDLEHGDEGGPPVLQESLDQSRHVGQTEVPEGVVVVHQDVDDVKGPGGLHEEAGPEGHHQTPPLHRLDVDLGVLPAFHQEGLGGFHTAGREGLLLPHRMVVTRHGTPHVLPRVARIALKKPIQILNPTYYLL